MKVFVGSDQHTTSLLSEERVQTEKDENIPTIASKLPDDFVI